MAEGSRPGRILRRTARPGPRARRPDLHTPAPDDLTDRLRHLTTLRGLHIHRCKEITDLTEVAALTGLTDLDLNGCAGIEDLTPISGLT
ncbi:hypothetical protein GCM10010306_069930 [Streptomyces umbrinus]|uniref:leucine-rich repeat domain-containing protein n=1 Tax=Streptomyces umbrinus TaxID=67370 RepID=UPI0016769F1A|nr:leucine-rich repeat domain-containing protein [Streptomyces umbrinus]GHB66465.1 hypothetical protein GCM10010306_069930 [Streptomyces umbrinus]